MRKALPVHEKAKKHAQAQPRGNAVVDVAAFAGAHARVKGNGALQNAQPCLEGRIQEIGVELQVDPRIQAVKQIAQGVVATELVRRADVCERDRAEMLQLEHLAGEKIPV